MRDNDVKKINYFVRILPRDSLYIIEAVELITRKVLDALRHALQDLLNHILCIPAWTIRPTESELPDGFL